MDPSHTDSDADSDARARGDSPLVRRLEETFYDDDFASVPDREFDVTEYGAVGDGEERCTEAIQSAIDAAADAGGGVVAIPEGTYRSGALFLASDVELRLDDGATLRAIQDDDAYPTTRTRVAGIEMEWPAALLTVSECENVRITGEGTVDGNGEYWWRKFNDMRGEYEERGLRWAVDYDCERVRPIVVYDSTDVRLSEFTVKRQGFWAVTMTYSERVHVDGVTVRGNVGGYGPSTDGINTDSSRDVLVEHCDVDGNDDCLCIKAGRDADGLRVDRPTENVVYRHCITREGGGLVTIGSETSGGVRNLEVYDIRGEGTDTGIRFKSAKVRGGLIEDVRFHDLEMDGVRTVFEWNLNWHPDYSYPTIPDDVPESAYQEHWEVLTEPVEPPERGVPEFRDITVTDLTATNTEGAVWDVTGYPERPISDVHLENVAADAPAVGTIEHATDWTMTDVAVRLTGEETDADTSATADDRDAIECRDCRNVDRPIVERL
ncbi:glycoside hydrolase family 28 protein [Halomontanus rarus]|uniref:glycoside hydrolase family 28 protein n=1 Tax=Halomontanus rarus TaxID=3034020 RepID=UPI0023E84710|nr:glycosyl hydrolase family 28 protein [Halovivax sp. TS33]